MNSETDRIIRVMSDAHGYDVSMFDEPFLVKCLGERLSETGMPTLAEYCGFLAADSREAEALDASLRITFSEFFRNAHTFALLERVVLPALMEAKAKSGHAELRIWSAACSGGQEAYSIAILLDEIARGRGHTIPFRILATDVSAEALALARKGVYDYANVQHVPLKYIRDCFTQAGDRFTILPHIKKSVEFAAYDLLDETSSCPPASIYGDFDLVVCSNLLFYYRKEHRQFILKKMHNSLVPGGYFMTGEAEADIVNKMKDFRSFAVPTAVFQKAKHRDSI